MQKHTNLDNSNTAIMQHRPIKSAQSLIHVVSVFVLNNSNLTEDEIKEKLFQICFTDKYLSTPIVEDISEHRMASTPRKVLQVLPACVIVEPFHVNAVRSRWPGSTTSRGSAFTLAPTKLHPQARSIEVIPDQLQTNKSSLSISKQYYSRGENRVDKKSQLYPFAHYVTLRSHPSRTMSKTFTLMTN